MASRGISRNPTLQDVSRMKNKSYNYSDSEEESERGVQDEEPFDPRKYVVPGSNVRDVEIWKEVFDLFDVDGNGSLTPMNIRNAMLTLGYNPKKQMIYQLVSDLDFDESGGVDFQEFVKMMTTKPCEKDTDEDIERVYYMYDNEKKGYITKEDMIEAAQEIKEELTEEEIEIIIQEIDPDGGGNIRKAYWMKFMKQKQY